MCSLPPRNLAARTELSLQFGVQPCFSYEPQIFYLEGLTEDMGK